MEAPEKIYRTTLYLDNDKGDTKWKKTPVAGAENIEYVRKDAFIEKAEKWLYLQLNEINMEGEDMENFLKDFKNYIEGE